MQQIQAAAPGLHQVRAVGWVGSWSGLRSACGACRPSASERKLGQAAPTHEDQATPACLLLPCVCYFPSSYTCSLRLLSPICWGSGRCCAPIGKHAKPWQQHHAVRARQGSRATHDLMSHECAQHAKLCIALNTTHTHTHTHAHSLNLRMLAISWNESSPVCAHHLCEIIAWLIESRVCITCVCHYGLARNASCK